MAFPASPSNNQIVTVNNVAYIYSSASNSWTRTVNSANITIANTSSSTSSTTGALVVAGGVGVAGNVFAGSVYTDNLKFANGNPYTSTTIANTTDITANASSGTNVGLSLSTTGVVAGNYGSATSIPTIVVDSKGRISSITTNAASSTITLAGTSGSGSVSGGGTLTFSSTNGVTVAVGSSYANISTPQDLRTTASPTFAGGTFSSNVTRSSRTLVTNFSGNTAPATPLQGDEWFRGNTGVMYKYLYDNVSNTYNWIDMTSALYNANTAAVANTIALRDSGGNLTATNFLGIASSARYADLAEIYASDKPYEPATVVVFGGNKEVTTTTKTHDTRVAGVVSTNPAYLMNSEAEGVPVAFTGRVPCLVRGPVDVGDVLVSSAYAGYAERIDNALYKPGCVLGKALGQAVENEFTTIEVVVGRF